MTNRQAALLGGSAALLLLVAIAGTMTAVARHGDEPEVVPVVQQPVVIEVATTTEATTTTSTAKGPTPIGAHAYAAGDITNGKIASSRRINEVWPLASLTKLMTATIALRQIPQDTPILIVDVPGGNPSSPGIQVGQTFAMKDVLSVMLISSSNEAAESLAAHVGRGEFIRMMNAQARDWGLPNTVFTDPSGLSAGNRSTASEVLDIAAKVFNENPGIFQTTQRASATVYALETGVAYTALATHGLVRDTGFLGGKTGYTDQARGNLLSLFAVGSRVEALVVLGSDDRFGDTRRLLATLKIQ